MKKDQFLGVNELNHVISIHLFVLWTKFMNTKQLIEPDSNFSVGTKFLEFLIHEIMPLPGFPPLMHRPDIDSTL
jgi:hypothetical protein